MLGRSDISLKNKQQESCPAGAFTQDAYEKPVCVVHSAHPLALRAIKDALSGDPSLCHSIKLYSNTSQPSKTDILVLDTCSVTTWPQVLKAWRFVGSRIIALISPDAPREQEELQMLYSGAQGVVTFAEDLGAKLSRAIHTIARGGLWITRAALTEYVRRTSFLLKAMSSRDLLITTREEQIIRLLRQGVSNKHIAAELNISERTVKFHVSNILKKYEIESRRELLAENPQPFSHFDVPATRMPPERALLPNQQHSLGARTYEIDTCRAEKTQSGNIKHFKNLENPLTS